MRDTVVLVEGESDRQALLALAARLDRDPQAEGICFVAMGGATNIDHYVRRYGPAGEDRVLAGLCDQGESRHFARALANAGLIEHTAAAADLAAAGFYVCDIDLEDELIRALGHEEMLAFIDSQNEISTFRIFQKQPAQRHRTLDQHLHRFCGIRAGRKVRYAAGMVEWLDLERIPQPLLDLVGSI